MDTSPSDRAASVFPATGPAAVRIEIQMGRVEVIASDRSDVQVDVAPANPARAGDRTAAEAVRIDQTGSTVVVVGPRRLNLFGPGDSVDVVVHVPTASDLQVAVNYGSAHLSGLLGAVRLAVDYGDTSLEHASGVEVRNGHGELRVDQVDGDAEIVFKSGRTRLGRVGGSLRIKGSDGSIGVESIGGSADIATSSGAVELRSPGPALTLRSAYGAVRIRELVHGVARIEGSYGNVTIGVRRGTAVWLDASSQHGVVRTDLAADAGPAEGEDTLELHARTGYGNIHVHRAVPAAPVEGNMP